MFFPRFSVDVGAARLFAGRRPITEHSEQEVYSLRENNMQSAEEHVGAKLCVDMGFALLLRLG